MDGKFKGETEFVNMGVDKTIFHALLEPDLPPEEKTHSRLWQEGAVRIAAGADTMAHAITTTHYHILENPEVERKLRAELEAALADKYLPVQMKVVDQLPYLVMIISAHFNMC